MLIPCPQPLRPVIHAVVHRWRRHVARRIGHGWPKLHHVGHRAIAHAVAQAGCRAGTAIIAGGLLAAPHPANPVPPVPARPVAARAPRTAALPAPVALPPGQSWAPITPELLPFGAPVTRQSQDDTPELAAGAPVFGLALPYATIPAARTVAATPVSTGIIMAQTVDTAPKLPGGTPALPTPTVTAVPDVTTVPTDVTPPVTTVPPRPITSLSLPVTPTTGGITATPVPEPGGIGVFAVALTALALARRLIRPGRRTSQS